jgi:hypothetical protein
MWDEAMTRRYAKLAPVFNRLVVFNTSSDSMHGNPDAVAHPEGRPRQSLALYYYTATWDDTRRPHNIIFRGRPGTTDKSGFDHKVGRVLDEVLPPVVRRQVTKVGRRIGL